MSARPLRSSQSRESSPALVLSLRIAKILYRLTMPGSLLIGTVFAVLRLGVATDTDSRLLHLFASCILLVGLALCMAFRRSRLFFALLSVTLAQTALAFLGPHMSERNLQIVGDAISMLLPLNLLVLAFVKERGIVSPAGRKRLAIIAGEALAIIALCVPQLFIAAEWLRSTFAPDWLTTWSRLSQSGLAAFALSLLVIMVPLIRRYRAVESSLLWTLVASFLALRTGGTTPQASLFFAAGGLALIVALLETSYRMAYHDELTQLPSRRALNEALLKLPVSYTIAMVDVDHFKNFNDSYGHEAGDQALRMVASRLSHIAGGGKAYRYGGEEFAIVFAGKEASEVVVYLDRMRRVIEQTKFIVRGKERRGKRRFGRGARKETSVTVSIGVAASNGEPIAPADVMRVADKALYRAKSRGRNCTVNAKGSSAVPAMSMAAF